MKTTIRGLLNKIYWDEREKDSRKDCIIICKDRFEGEKEIPFCQIVEIKKEGLNILGDVLIPYHRIIKIKINQKTLWGKRK